MLLLLACAAAFPLSLLLVYWHLQPPRNFAPGLPVVPLWVAFLPLLRSWLGLPLPGQDETYARYIEPRMRKHGAVVLYFGSRWNVLIACPEGMKQLFSQERTTYQKQGNHKKLPNAVISALTGGNIISETGELWRKYAQIIRPALKDDVDATKLDIAAGRLVKELEGHKDSVTGLVQRYSMEAVSLCVLGRDLKVCSMVTQLTVVSAGSASDSPHPRFSQAPHLSPLIPVYSFAGPVPAALPQPPSCPQPRRRPRARTPESPARRRSPLEARPPGRREGRIKQCASKAGRGVSVWSAE